MAHWAEQYVGISYQRFDCAALCVQVQQDIYGRDIDLPIERASGLRGISQQIGDLQADYADPVDMPEEGDAVLMIGRGHLNHIGTLVMIRGQAWVLHAMKNVGQTVLHRIHQLESIGLSVEGYYRWK